MNIIIPIGGIGKRFIKDGYNLPKPLIKSFGKPIIFWNLENLKVGEEDKIFIVYRKEFERFNFEDLILNKFNSKNIIFIPIEYDTRGSSETILHALNHMEYNDLSKLTLVVDSDNFYTDDIIDMSKNENDNLIFYTEDYSSSPIFSYINIDENNFVTDIKEKEKISDNACVGAYCFKDGILLKSVIEEVLINGEKEQNEYYISFLYKNLISKGYYPKSKLINNFVCLGTPSQLQSFSSKINSNSEKYRFCFDLDNTLVSYPKISGDYTSVLPIPRVINFLNFLHEMGHTIIIYTARKMRTFSGNVGQVQANIAKITIDTLEKFNIKYDELYFGKPYAQFYIDDLAVKSFDNLERETGFYDIHPKARNHNKIEVYDDYIIKISESIDGEKYYYQNIPNELKEFFPKLIDCGDNFIKISKIQGIPISFLNSNKTLNQEIIFKIFKLLDTIHNTKIVNDVDINIYENYSNKLQERLEFFDYSDYENSILIKDEVVNILKEYEKNNMGKFGIIHGDPVFTNILITNTDEIRFIDMRGRLGNTNTIFGDIFYDYAKIYQSIIGYDFILMNKEIDEKYVNKNKEIFESYFINKFSEKYLNYLKTIAKSLILTLIPIHNNDKCEKYFKLINSI